MKKLIIMITLLLIPAFAWSADEGPNNPASNAGGTNWTNPGNATGAHDNSCASYSGTTQDWLYLYNLGFTAPADGATIDGIVVLMHAVNIGTAGQNDFDVSIGTDFDTTPSLCGTAKGFTTGERLGGQCSHSQDASMGSSSDDWSCTLTGADVKATGFGIAVRDKNATAGELLVDYFSVTITYTDPVAGAGQVIIVTGGD